MTNDIYLVKKTKTQHCFPSGNTFFTQGNEVFWQREWGATLIHSNGANNARGVAILIRNSFDCVVEESVIDTNGRFIILKVLLSGEPTLLVNIYGPNRHNELVAFYHTVLQTIVNKNFDDIENIIMGGDLNCPLNPIIGKRGGNLIPRQAVINTIEMLQSKLDLHDIWRVKNQTKCSYTSSQSNPLIFSRLDYWLISNSLSDNVCHVDMISAIKTDHCAMVIELQDVEDKVKGPGFNILLPTWIQEGKQDLSDPRSVWDWVKYKVKKYSRWYSLFYTLDEQM